MKKRHKLLWNTGGKSKEICKTKQRLETMNCQATGTGTWDLGLGTWDLGLGTWDLGSGIWDLGEGAAYILNLVCFLSTSNPENCLLK